MASPLELLNALPSAAAEQELLTCCHCASWARAVAARRPLADVTELVAAGREAVAALTWEDVTEALAAHPRIGQHVGGTDAESVSSRREQAGVDDADAAVLAELAAVNQAYEARFDRVFLIFASGRTPEQIIKAATVRLGNDEETEREVIRAELADIAALRLEQLVSA